MNADHMHGQELRTEMQWLSSMYNEGHPSYNQKITVRTAHKWAQQTMSIFNSDP